MCHDSTCMWLSNFDKYAKIFILIITDVLRISHKISSFMLSMEEAMMCVTNEAVMT